MEQNRYPEIDLILNKVKEKYKLGDYTTNDYRQLSRTLQETGAGALSPSTLKRLFGYVSDRHKPTITTLDILAKYIGYKNYADYYECVMHKYRLSSSFLTANQIWSKFLKQGDRIEIAWAPDRKIVVEYQGDNWYVVIYASNTKLESGDCTDPKSFLSKLLGSLHLFDTPCS
ncbi:MAG: hypothetical protein J6K74_06360 [Marinifilaceae bacterium]|nr:hypothetical protein [Marinifilaceae bacterium]